MGRITDVIFRNWNNGETMNEADYEQEREIIRVAINDNYDRLLERYTKTEVDTLLASLDAKTVDNNSKLEQHKASSDHDGRYYTETEIDAFLATRDAEIDLKADKSTTYTKTEVDDALGLRYTKIATDALLLQKADKELTYTKGEVNALLTLGDTEFLDGGSFLDKYTSSTGTIDGGVF